FKPNFLVRAHLVVNNRVPFFIDVLCGETSIWYLAWWMEFLSINVTAKKCSCQLNPQEMLN
ncbi:hypothetical protein KEJ28_04965, partial [Candidatus Bathyarchaeota archaeon]|nr:hypothetical protein [Candidatus Bathyarchaeota archaeon]